MCILQDAGIVHNLPAHDYPDHAARNHLSGRIYVEVRAYPAPSCLNLEIIAQESDYALEKAQGDRCNLCGSMVLVSMRFQWCPDWISLRTS